MNNMMKDNDKANDKIGTNIRSDTYFIKKTKNNTIIWPTCKENDKENVKHDEKGTKWWKKMTKKMIKHDK